MPEPTPIREVMFPDAPEVKAYRDLETLHHHATNVAAELLEIIKLARRAHLNLQGQDQAQAHLAAIPELFEAAMTVVAQSDSLATAANVTIFREFEREGKVNILMRDVKQPG